MARWACVRRIERAAEQADAHAVDVGRDGLRDETWRDEIVAQCPAPRDIAFTAASARCRGRDI